MERRGIDALGADKPGLNSGARGGVQQIAALLFQPWGETEGSGRSDQLAMGKEHLPGRPSLISQHSLEPAAQASTCSKCSNTNWRSSGLSSPSLCQLNAPLCALHTGSI
jgi:hypothetical protein